MGTKIGIMKTIIILCLLPIMCLCQASRTTIDITILLEDELHPHKYFIRDARYKIKLQLNQLNIDKAITHIYTENYLRQTKVIIYDTMYKNFTEECNIIQKAVNDANEKSKDIQHCYNTLEKRLEELEKEANANAEPCIQRIPILLDDIYNLTNNITCEGNALIEDMDNVFPSCYWTMMKMETCIIAKLNKIRSHLEVFDKNYSLTSEIQRLAFQHITESGVICLKEQVQTAISKARTDIKVAEECIKDTR